MGESSGRASDNLAAWLAGTGRGVAITGASGWIGGAAAHVAIQALEAAGAGPAGRLRLFGSAARTARIAGRDLPVEALADATALGGGEWLVLHFAVIGADRIADPAALRAANDALLQGALALAEGAVVRRLVHASSGAVHLPLEASPDKRAYADLKREQETAVLAWGERTGTPILAPRIFNVGGPYMTQPQNYALGSFILQALRDGVIRIGARKPVLRSYVHGLELARVMFDLALDEVPALAFDTAGTETVEMAALAAAVGHALDLPDLRIERPPLEAGPEDRYVGDGAIYQSALARAGAEPIGLHQIIRDTAAWLRS
jgi:nucleoside-diphosphate-sugar epimerase